VTVTGRDLRGLLVTSGDRSPPLTGGVLLLDLACDFIIQGGGPELIPSPLSDLWVDSRHHRDVAASSGPREVPYPGERQRADTRRREQEAASAAVAHKNRTIKTNLKEHQRYPIP
jgi:hypothetical protein